MQAGLAWAMLSRWGWRWLVAASSVPLLLLMLLYPLLPESPFWRLATGQTREVRVLLQRIARMNGQDLPPGRLQASAQSGFKVPFCTCLGKKCKYGAHALLQCLEHVTEQEFPPAGLHPSQQAVGKVDTPSFISALCSGSPAQLACALQSGRVNVLHMPL